MKLLNRYIFLQFATSFLFASAAFVALFTLVDMVENIDDFIDRNVGIVGILQYYTLTIPSTVQITAPVATLLASILTAGRLSASSELAALRSAGLSMRQLILPFLTGGVIIALANFFNASVAEPTAASAKIAFKQTHLNEIRSGLSDGANLQLLEPDGRIITIGSFDPIRSIAKDVTIERFDGAHLRSRTDAPVMLFEPQLKRWIMPVSSERSFDPTSKATNFSKGRDTLALALSPQSLRELYLQPEEMTLTQHYRYLTEKQQAGFPGLERATVKLHSKAAMPLASIVVILIGVPLSAIRQRTGRAAEIALALFLGFLFLGLQRTVATMGYNGIIEPWIAAWLPLLLFLAAGLLLYRKTE
ncbi:MAG: LptF/LptG family permease [Chlorobiaceae bacterium]|nr:LptF/LptG family permease [Chlorobiaceae bacterium]